MRGFQGFADFTDVDFQKSTVLQIVTQKISPSLNNNYVIQVNKYFFWSTSLNFSLFSFSVVVK